MNETQFDCIVVGAGMVGLAAACALSKLDLNVAIIEVNKPALRWSKDSHALRVSAINQTSESLLTELAVWDDILKNASEFNNMHVWDENSSGELSFSASQAGINHLGHLIENRVIVRALWKAVQDKVNIICPDNLETLKRANDHWSLTLGSGKQLSTPLVIAADGVRSKTREMVNLSTKPVFYNQHGLVATIKTEHAHQQTAWQRFLHTGPLAFLPLQDPNLCSIVWSVPPDMAKDLIAMDEKTFNESLSTAFDNKLGNCTLIGERASFPLYHHHAEHYSLEGLTLIGDAAHGIHPLAGLGANLGFHDVICLKAQIQKALSKKRPYFTASQLKRFEKEARCQNEATLQMMSILNGLFSNDRAILAKIRGIGMNTINKHNILKNIFVTMAGDNS